MTIKNSELEKRVTELEVQIKLMQAKIQQLEENKLKDIKIGDVAGLLGSFINKK